jgi:serine/threonine protein kinase
MMTNMAFDVSRGLDALSGTTLWVTAASAEASYALTRLFSAHRSKPVTICYHAVRQTGSAELPGDLLLRVPSDCGLNAEQWETRRRMLSERFQIEGQTLSRLKRAKSVPHLFDGRVFRDSEHKKPLEPVLIREYVPGCSLHEWMANYALANRLSEFEGIGDVEEWFRFAKGLVHALEQIHQERVIHGDLLPEHIIIHHRSNDGGCGHDDETPAAAPKRERIFLINAEEDGFAETSLDSENARGMFRRKYDSPSKLFVKAKENLPAEIRNPDADWYAPADIFSLGAILLDLACGTRQPLEAFLGEERYNHTWNRVPGYQAKKSDRQLKNFVLKAVGESERRRRREDVLRITEVIMACLRTQSETQASDLRTVRIVIDQFSAIGRASSERQGPQRGYAGLYDLLEEETKTLRKPFQRVIHRQADLLAQDLRSVQDNGLLRVSGSRQHLVDVFVTVLRSLEAGEECRALTTPTFFFESNMGPYGRVTSALYLASKRGVYIDWILAVDECRSRDRRVAEVLEAQRQGALEEMQDCQTFKMRFALVDAGSYRRLLKQKLTFVEVGPKLDEDGKVLIAPDYKGEAGGISVLRLWAPGDAFAKRRGELMREFDGMSERARPITRYQR